MDINGFFKKKKPDDKKEETTDKRKTLKNIDIEELKEKIYSLAGNKKIMISVAVVVVLLLGYYTWDAFLKPPTYKPLPTITPTAMHRIHRTPRRVKTVHRVKAKPTTASNGKKETLPVHIASVPVPKLKLPGVNTNIEELAKKNTQAIVKATKKQEQELFDIFKIEPEQEYQIDRLINLARKQDDFLAIEEAILQRKVKIEKLLNKLQEKNAKEKELAERVNMLTQEINSLKEKLNSIKATQSQPPSPVQKLSEKNPFPFSMPQKPNLNIISTANYMNELNNLSVGIIYNYQGKKIAVINNNGRIYKVGIGDKVTEHFIVKNILPSGIIVALSMKAKGVYIPLSMSSITSKRIHFGTVNLKKGGTSSISSPYASQEKSSSTTPPFTPPPNMTTPPVSGGM